MSRWTKNKSARIATHASIFLRTSARTRGLGKIVSRFPLGIWSTSDMVVDTTVTITDPRSTRRRSHSLAASATSHPPSRILTITSRGAYFESCVEVV